MSTTETDIALQQKEQKKDDLLHAVSAGKRLNSSNSIEQSSSMSEEDILGRSQVTQDSSSTFSLPSPDDLKRDFRLSYTIETGRDKHLTKLKPQCLDKMVKLIRQLLPELNLSDDYRLKAKMAELKSKQPKLANDELALALLSDYCNIKALIKITLPLENCTYCKIDSSPGGVTDKVSLVEYQHAISRLNYLNRNNITLLNYLECRPSFCLNVEAIIKLPKYNYIRMKNDHLEVIREAVALELAKCFGFHTTSFSLLKYNGVPALFIPFANITLLDKYATGQWVDDELHLSTISAIGEGLFGDMTIEDFGRYLAYLWLCGDPDAIGCRLQNKALVDHMKLFFFDQVFYSSFKHFVVDSGLNITSRSYIEAWYRHTRGRNFTLINDASFEHKFDGFSRLVNNQDKIIKMFEQIISDYEQQISQFEKAHVKTEANAQTATIVRELLSELVTIKQSAIYRIKEIQDFLNSYGVDASQYPDLKKALLLEKCFNRPHLYTADGRPYRNPWTIEHPFKLSAIQYLTNERICLRFNNKVDTDALVYILYKMGIEQCDCPSPYELVISQQELEKINERNLFFETQPQIVQACEYMNNNEVKWLLATYCPTLDENTEKKILRAIEEYGVHKQAFLQSVTPHNITALRQHWANIVALCASLNNKALDKHLQLKLNYDVAHSIMSCFKSPETLQLVQKVYQLAIQLDRLTQMNEFLLEALSHPTITNTHLTAMMSAIIELAPNPQDYQQAKHDSDTLSNILTKYVSHMQKITPSLTVLKGDLKWLMHGNPSFKNHRHDEQSQTATAPKLQVAANN